MDRLIISALETADEGVEIVERKGLGHPDSICDALAEALSRNLCREYRQRFGNILHHNVDIRAGAGGDGSDPGQHHPCSRSNPLKPPRGLRQGLRWLVIRTGPVGPPLSLPWRPPGIEDCAAAMRKQPRGSDQVGCFQRKRAPRDNAARCRRAASSKQSFLKSD
jgi:hypothetical protein